MKLRDAAFVLFAVAVAGLFVWLIVNWLRTSGWGRVRLSRRQGNRLAGLPCAQSAANLGSTPILGSGLFGTIRPLPACRWRFLLGRISVALAEEPNA
jgi:hypothetical protein